MWVKIVIVMFSLFFTVACDTSRKENTLVFITSAGYPPFEYYSRSEIVGFDIDLAKLIAQKLNKTAEFKHVSFSTLIASLLMGDADMAISTLSATEERKKNVDFSVPYYQESMAMVFNKSIPLLNLDAIKHQKIAVQLGTTMQDFLQKRSYEGTDIVLMDNNSQAIEALKAGHVQGVFIDKIQAKTFADMHSNLEYGLIIESGNGYSIAFPKQSPYLTEVNQAITEIKESGELAELEKKWLGK